MYLLLDLVLEVLHLGIPYTSLVDTLNKVESTSMTSSNMISRGKDGKSFKLLVTLHAAGQIIL